MRPARRSRPPAGIHRTRRDARDPARLRIGAQCFTPDLAGRCVLDAKKLRCRPVARREAAVRGSVGGAVSGFDSAPPGSVPRFTDPFGGAS
jgi:hypothetical protein